MTFKRRLWNTIILTLLIFLVYLRSESFLRELLWKLPRFSQSEISTLFNLLSWIVFIPFVLFTIQTILHYLLKKEYPVQKKTINHPALQIFGWAIIITTSLAAIRMPKSVAGMMFFLFLYNPNSNIWTLIDFGILFILALYWFWIIKELKGNYGVKTGVGSFLLPLVCVCIYVFFFTSCPVDKPLKNYYYGCLSCDNLNNIKLIHPEDCTKLCPNREQTESGCQLKDCPSEAPIRNLLGDCM